jgi:hypothetical protein
LDAEAGSYLLYGHKWFTSAPMSDGFLTLAKAGSNVNTHFDYRLAQPHVYVRLVMVCPASWFHDGFQPPTNGTKAFRSGA